MSRITRTRANPIFTAVGLYKWFDLDVIPMVVLRGHMIGPGRPIRNTLQGSVTDS
jgi:hypothetical protein